MSRLLYYKNDGGIKIMSTEELEGFYDLVLQNLANNDGPGTISSTSGGETYTSIGTFTDTSFTGPSGDEETVITSVEYQLYQDLNEVGEYTITRPLKYKDQNTPFQLLSDTEITTLADNILQFCVTEEGSNSYQLAGATPDDGGTWVNVGAYQITDVFNGASETVKYLFKKLSANLPERKPLKLVDSTTFQIFTNNDIESIAKRVRERIVQTGVGQYLLQDTTPTPGTWVSVGSVEDTRPLVEEFTATYTTTYGGSYVGDINYTTEEELTYSSEVAYVGPTFVGYEAAVEYTGVVEFATPNTTTENYDITYDTVLFNVYTGPSFSSQSFFTGFFAGEASYEGAYTGTYTNVIGIGILYTSPSPQFDSVIEYTSRGTDWVWTTTYTGPISNYTNNVFAVSFQDGRFIWQTDYTISLTFNQSFLAPGQYWTSQFTDAYISPTTFTGSASFNSAFTLFYQAVNYTGAVADFYLQEYYTGLNRYSRDIQYTGPGFENAGQAGVFFNGVEQLTYTNVYTRERYYSTSFNLPVQFGSSPGGFLPGGINYYAGPAIFTSSRSETNYFTSVRATATPVSYTTSYESLQARYSTDEFYERTFQRSYVNELSEYTGLSPVLYTNETAYELASELQYANEYEATYSKIQTEVSDSQGIKTLWRRIA